MALHSIEHNIVFSEARRILKFIAPEYRAVARLDLSMGQSVLDLKIRTVEVPDGEDPLSPATGIVLNAGILRLRDRQDLDAVFGRFVGNETPEEMADQHVRAEAEALVWARDVMLAHFPGYSVETIDEYLGKFSMTKNDWEIYFRSP